MRATKVQGDRASKLEPAEVRPDILQKISKYLSSKNLPIVLDREDGLIVLRFENKGLSGASGG